MIYDEIEDIYYKSYDDYEEGDIYYPVNMDIIEQILMDWTLIDVNHPTGVSIIDIETLLCQKYHEYTSIHLDTTVFGIEYDRDDIINEALSHVYPDIYGREELRSKYVYKCYPDSYYDREHITCGEPHYKLYIKDKLEEL